MSCSSLQRQAKIPTEEKEGTNRALLLPSLYLITAHYIGMDRYAGCGDATIFFGDVFRVTASNP
jgi:hypothetical protein